MNAQILPYNDILPRIDESVFIGSGVIISGDVEIGAHSSIWFNTVIRGDVNAVRIGQRTNIQDLSMLHVTNGRSPLRIGSSVTVGHRAVLHGCTVEDGCLIGMGSIVLDDAVVGRDSLVAAGSLVPEGYRVPSGTLVAGVPATVKRTLTADEIAGLRRSADHYAMYALTYRQMNEES